MATAKNESNVITNGDMILKVLKSSLECTNFYFGDTDLCDNFMKEFILEPLGLKCHSTPCEICQTLFNKWWDQPANCTEAIFKNYFVDDI